MKTQNEIVAQVKNEDWEHHDVLGFSRSALIEVLDFEHAKEFLVDGATADQWAEPSSPADAMLEYLPFALEKAQGEQGMSAYRSISKMTAWAWASDVPGLMDAIIGADHDPYGLPALRLVAEALGERGLAVWDEHATAETNAAVGVA